MSNQKADHVSKYFDLVQDRLVAICECRLVADTDCIRLEDLSGKNLKKWKLDGTFSDLQIFEECFIYCDGFTKGFIQKNK